MPEAEEMVDLPTEGASVTVNIPEEKVIVQPDLFSQPEGEGSVETSMEADSEEHEEYSKNVQKRINKMTKKLREAERQQSAAIEYAKNVQQENNALRGKVQSLDEGYVAEYGDRIATQNESLTKDLEEAIATNDSAAQVDLNKKLAQLAIEEERVRAAKAVQEQNQNASAQQAAYQQQLAAYQQQQAQQQKAPVRPDPKAEQWARDNPWFGEDDAMTFAAFGIHKRLVEQEHFDTTSKEYYDTLDNEIRNAFPHKFTGGEVVSVSEGRRPQQAVASATRSSNSGRKSSVRLSPSEVVIARKLGVPLEEYARHKRYV
jgi:hypothetical protein